MSVIPHTAVTLPLLVDFDGARARRWSDMAVDDVGDPVFLTRYNDRTIQVGGTFGVGGTVVFEGSCDGVQWDTMRDIFNVDVSATANKLITLTEVPLYVRPHVTAGDGTTSITVTVVAVGRG